MNEKVVVKIDSYYCILDEIMTIIMATMQAVQIICSIHIWLND